MNTFIADVHANINNAGDIYDFTDYDKIRGKIFESVKSAAERRFPLENETHKLALTDLHYPKKFHYSKTDQKNAILEGRSLTQPLRGRWELIDKATGNVVSKTSMRTLASVPYMTERGTFIRNGSEAVIPTQARLVSGVYTRRKDNGEVEAHVNVKPGSGKIFKVFMNPSDSVFYMKQGTRNVKLYPLLKTLGMDDQQIKQSWGTDIYKANTAAARGANTLKSLRSLIPVMTKKETKEATADAVEKEASQIEEQTFVNADETQRLKDMFSRMELDPISTEQTLGRPYTRMTPDALLRTTGKLIRVARNEQNPDARDSMLNQRFYNAPDIFAEHILKDAGAIGRSLLWKATNKGDVTKIPSGVFNKYIDSVFNKSRIPQVIEEVNPLEIYQRMTAVTKMGSGGIGDVRSAPGAARLVQNTYRGFVDPSQTSECYDNRTEVMTKNGWTLFSHLTEDMEIACLIDGELSFNKPYDLISYDYDDIMYTGHNALLDYCVTPNHRMYVKPANHIKKNYYPEYRFEYPEKVSQHTRNFLCGGFEGIEKEALPFTLPSVKPFGTDKQIKGNPPIGANIGNITEPIDIVDWCTFLGWYLSEGSFVWDTDKGYYSVDISQKKEANPDKWEDIDSLLSRLPFAYCTNQDRTFNITGKQLTSYVKQFGKCDDKWIPEEVFDAPIEARQAFVQALLDGDGTRDRSGGINSLNTTSYKLAEDFQRLVFSMGKSSRITAHEDTREERYLTCYNVRVHLQNERQLRVKDRHGNSNYGTKHYRGKVYCASVPGGLLYVRRNNSAGFWCGNSLKVGLTNQMAYGVRKGSNGLLYAPLRNRFTGKTEWVNTIKASQIPVLVPGGYQKGDKLASVMMGDKVDYMDPKKIQYEIPSGDSLFALTSNMVPFKKNVHAQRLLMGSKHNTQALSLVSREAPLVQTVLDNGKTAEETAGSTLGAVKAKGPGTVIKATHKNLVVRYDDGTTDEMDLYNNFPFNRKSYIRNTLNVKAGDKIRKGQTLAGSNYTDKNGTSALGSNLSVAYMIHHGKNYRDAVAISASAAKKLTSEHMYNDKLKAEKENTVNKRAYMAMYPGKFNEKQFKTIREDGTVAPGTVLQKGDPMLLAFRENPRTTKTMNRKIYSNKAMIWHHPFPGVVTDVANNKNGHMILVRAEVPAQQGDKVAGRFGNKSVIAEVIPDDEMPQTKDGKPIDILMSPLGIVSRLNDGQVYEALLGKIARKTGKPYKLPGFIEGHSADFVEAELKKHGLTEGEDLKDPISGKTAKDITTGVTHVLKLHHTAEGKGSQRSTGAYTQDQIPATGGKSGAKTLGNLVLSAVVAHDALDVLKDMKLIKGQQNDDFWRQYKMGESPAMPSTPLIYDKFLAHIQGAGINLNKDKNVTRVFAMTDKDAKKLTGNGQVKTSDTYGAKDLTPISGGLFDPAIFGQDGNNWGYIDMPYKIPNPVMEDPIKHILGLTGKQYQAALKGEQAVRGFTGPDAVTKALSKVNVLDEMEQAAHDIKFGTKSGRDKAIKKYRTLYSLSKNNVEPSDFMLSRIPVLPPKYRPITAGGDLTMVSDANYMYKNLMDDVKDFNTAQEIGMPDDMVAQQRAKIYESFKQLTGLTSPEHGKLKDKNVGGLLKWVFGKSSPKHGAFQRRVISTALDVSGRGVVTPNSSLKLNEVGMPESQAWDLYEPFVIRKLVQNGYKATDAVKLVANKSKAAYDILQNVVKERPVIITRAPALHKYSVIGLWPKITKGHTLQVPVPLVDPMNMDYDGDTASFYVPVSDDAVKETVEKMMPDKNLLSARKFKAHYIPEEEYRLGMFLASRSKKQRPVRKFRTKEELVQAYKQGLVSIDEPVNVGL